MSRQTLFALLLALLLGLGLYAWSLGHMGACDHYLAGDHHYPADQDVRIGHRQVAIPCAVWVPRQPMPVQILWLLDAALAVVFCIGVLSDLQRARQRSRGSADGKTRGMSA